MLDTCKHYCTALHWLFFVLIQYCTDLSTAAGMLALVTMEIISICEYHKSLSLLNCLLFHYENSEVKAGTVSLHLFWALQVFLVKQKFWQRTSFFLWSTKGEFQSNVQTALFHTSRGTRDATLHKIVKAPQKHFHFWINYSFK